MTIGIGVMCEDSQAVVVACDRMITASYPPIEFEHNIRKLSQIAPTCLAVTAGNALAHIEVFRAAQAALEGLTAPEMSRIVDTVKGAFVEQRKRHMEDRILGPRGITLEEFYREYVRAWPVELAMPIDREIASGVYQLEMLIAGIDKSGAHVYGIDDPGSASCYDSLGYHAIGNGATHALLRLIGSGVLPSSPLKEVVYFVYAAKRAAELAPGVGETTDMAVMRSRKDGIEILGKAVMDRLAAIYDEEMEPKTEELRQSLENLCLEEGE